MFFVASPVPEPSPVLLLGGGLLSSMKPGGDAGQETTVVLADQWIVSAGRFCGGAAGENLRRATLPAGTTAE